MARPTKYKKKYVKFVDNYLDECIKTMKIPYIQEIAFRLHVVEDTLGNWGEANDEFLGAIKRVKNYQKMALMQMCLGKRGSPAGPIFLLKTVHGLIEVDEHRHGGADGGPINVILSHSESWRIAEANKAANKTDE